MDYPNKLQPNDPEIKHPTPADEEIERKNKEAEEKKKIQEGK